MALQSFGLIAVLSNKLHKFGRNPAEFRFLPTYINLPRLNHLRSFSIRFNTASVFRSNLQIGWISQELIVFTAVEELHPANMDVISPKAIRMINDFIVDDWNRFR
ncbi:MAG: hypothetical protein GVY20_04460 [Bacteroidetes bacterium]|nr:hypothetical protein [Bacteroidota bacterium]